MEDDKQREKARLESLREFGILDTPADGAFDRITGLAARFFEAPISLISLVDEDRVWFKSAHGIDLEQIAREPGLCASVIYRDEAYIVEDAIDDPRTLTHPLVAGEFGLRFYGAAPLITAAGHRLGTINIIDFEPREFSAEDREMLAHFAGLVMDQMELRLQARQIVERVANDQRESDDEELASDDVVTICAWTKRVQVDGEWLSFEDFLAGRLGASVSHGMHPEVAQNLRREKRGSDD